MIKKANLAVFLSGKGSNFVALLDAIAFGKLDVRVAVVISNNSEAGGLRIAADKGIPAEVIERTAFTTGEEFGSAILIALQTHDVDLIALAGYLRKIPPLVTRAFPRRIVNIHPALLPKFGGKGMYGHFVHEAVIKAGESETGATVHYVDEIYDNGDIIAQRKIAVHPGETPESLGRRVLEIEHQLYPEILQHLVNQILQKKY